MKTIGRQHPGLSPEELEMVSLVADFVDRDVRPVARDLEHNDIYPEDLIEQMKLMGVYGMTVPERYGGLSVSTTCYSMITEELARGWMSLAGAVGGHSVVCKLIELFGTDDQRARYLPALATGNPRATMALTEPGGGSDLQAMTTKAHFDGTTFIVNGAKSWITNGRRSGLIALLCKTDPDADPSYRGMSILLVEPGSGLTITSDFPKLGYKGVETCGLVFDDFRSPADSVLGGEPGKGFVQMMKGLEYGRIQVASRAIGVARAAFEDSLQYAQERHTFGRPIWRHQSVGNYLAEMATMLEASRQLVHHAARVLDSGLRADLEAGMAKLFASEAAMTITMNAVRIHGAYGYSTEYDVERYFRDAPLMIVGEGTNEIQKNVIVRQLVDRATNPEQ